MFLYHGGVSVVMRSLLLGPIVDRIGERWAMRLGTFAMIAGLVLYPVPRSHVDARAGHAADADRHRAPVPVHDRAGVPQRVAGGVRDDRWG